MEFSSDFTYIYRSFIAVISLLFGLTCFGHFELCVLRFATIDKIQLSIGPFGGCGELCLSEDKTY